MVPLSLFHSRSFAGANLVTLLFYMALTGSLFFLPFLMMQVHGYSAFASGSVFLPFVAMALLIGRLSGRICARFGAKMPLIVASLSVAAGLLLFALPGAGHGSYWISFFPAMIVQGFGMALAITPLTTVALGSVESEHSGLASGVNNAVTRVAGLLAVAVLGVLVYGAFSASLDARMEEMEMPGEIRIAMEAAKADLGAAEAPAGVDAGTEARIEGPVEESFVAGFRAVMLVSAGLALTSALVAALLVADKRVTSASGQPARRVDAGSVPVLRAASLPDLAVAPHFSVWHHAAGENRPIVEWDRGKRCTSPKGVVRGDAPSDVRDAPLCRTGRSRRGGAHLPARVLRFVALPKPVTDLVLGRAPASGQTTNPRRSTAEHETRRDIMTEQGRHRHEEYGSDPDGPRQLPYSDYPKAVDVAPHGMQPLPASLPLVDFARAEPYRSRRYTTVLAPELTKDQHLQMAWVIAAGFVRWEPQARHLRPPKHPPAGLMEARHTDPFGTDPFGSWDTETQMYWIVRLTALTDPTSPQGAIEVNEETLAQSLAILDGDGRVIGAAFNETMAPLGVEPPLREDDPFLDTLLGVWEPVYGALGAQDAAALPALSARYPKFREAYEKGKVSHHILIARSEDLPKGDAFELVAASAERCQALGYEYLVTEATNQWTGAAFEALGGVRVHFRPFLVEPAVRKSDEPLEDVTTSPNGFLADKDSGGMFYVTRLS